MAPILLVPPMSEAQEQGGTFTSGSIKGISYTQSSSTTGLYKETYKKERRPEILNTT